MLPFNRRTADGLGELVAEEARRSCGLMFPIPRIDYVEINKPLTGDRLG
jgi:hypothetical protein